MHGLFLELTQGNSIGYHKVDNDGTFVAFFLYEKRSRQ